MLKNLQAKLKDQKGFSLVELIVVIAIMVILIAMLVPNVVGYIKKATWATEQNGASTVFSAAQTYATDCYTKGCWNGDTQIDQSVLVEEKLLTKTPSITYTIYTTGQKNTPAISYVSWSSTNAPTGVSPMYPLGK